MTSLVGYTGFVGSNIYAGARAEIGGVYNSKNIAEAYGSKPDLLIYAGMRAEKYMANDNPDADMRLVLQAEENIRKICPKRVALISTIDVFKNSRGKDEDAEIDPVGLHPYGLNRYRLERWVLENYGDALVVRLPALYGSNIKKNFIYDFINVIPFTLKEEKFAELLSKDACLQNYYEKTSGGFYKLRILTDGERANLKEKFRHVGFTALNFTDSRNVYQFYPLSRLWDDMKIMLNAKAKIWHAATEPLSAAEIYEYLTEESFVNEISARPLFYDYRTKYAELFGNGGGYLMKKAEVLKDIKIFVGDMSR